MALKIFFNVIFFFIFKLSSKYFKLNINFEGINSIEIFFNV